MVLCDQIWILPLNNIIITTLRQHPAKIATNRCVKQYRNTSIFGLYLCITEILATIILIILIIKWKERKRMMRRPPSKLPFATVAPNSFDLNFVAWIVPFFGTALVPFQNHLQLSSLFTVQWRVTLTLSHYWGLFTSSAWLFAKTTWPCLHIAPLAFRAPVSCPLCCLSSLKVWYAGCKLDSALWVLRSWGENRFVFLTRVTLCDCRSGFLSLSMLVCMITWVFLWLTVCYYCYRCRCYRFELSENACQCFGMCFAVCLLPMWLFGCWNPCVELWPQQNLGFSLEWSGWCHREVSNNHCFFSLEEHTLQHICSWVRIHLSSGRCRSR